MRITVIILLLIINSLPALMAQSKVELLRMGDQAFTNKNYASAAFFYNKILTGDNAGLLETVYPYDLKYYDKPTGPRGKKQKTDSLETDSLPADSSLSISHLTVTQDSGETVVSITPEEVEMLYIVERLADSYRLSYQYEQAEKWYEKLVNSNTGTHQVFRYWYGNILMQNGKYDEAMGAFTDFLVNHAEPETGYYIKAERDIQKCVFAKKAMQEPVQRQSVMLLDSIINAGSSNFALSYFGDESSFVFTSSREGEKSLEASRQRSKKEFCSLYTISIDDAGTSPEEAVNFPALSLDHEGSAVLSPDGNRLFFTRWNDSEENPECALYVSRNLNGRWLTPKKLNEQVNMPGFRTMHPALSPEGDLLYFSSNRPGGEGKMDIWYCTIDEFDNTGPVENVGPGINTPENEISPFVHEASKTLYFSSDGHTGLGGQDVFHTIIEKDYFAEVVNAGYPVNSSRSDAHFILNEDKQTGYLTSDRSACENCEAGCQNIYKVITTPMIISMTGKVYDEESGDIISNSLVYFRDVTDQIEEFFAITDETGTYHTELRKDMQFFVTAQKSGYFKDGTTQSTFEIEKTTEFVHDFYLKFIPEGDIEIPGIEYDYDKATLRPESKKLLDELVEFLELNDHIVIEISSHTDERGADDYNMKLSQERAQSVVDYMIEKNLPEDRFVAQGYGESKLLVENADTEEDHQRNRRTAFRILSEDYEGEK